MNERYSLDSFIADIDKIISGESLIMSECEDGNEEDKELLLLAQILARADYAPESQSRTEKMKKMFASIRENGEMQDDDLDMVAGGINMNDILGARGNKDNI